MLPPEDLTDPFPVFWPDSWPHPDRLRERLPYWLEIDGILAAGEVLGAAGMDCDPIAVPAPQSAYIAQPYQQPQTSNAVYQNSAQPALQSASITENTESLGELGTPGYYAVHGNQNAAASPAPTESPAPQQVYSYGGAAQQAATPAATPAIVPAINGTTRYTLQAGDTVYSLARKSCTSVAAFKTLNGIDDTYYIRAGDAILLPAGKCAE